MIYQTRAIVFRTVKYGETSLITDIYTEEKGHQTFIIHSVRKAKATTPPSYLQLMSLVEMVAYHKEQQKIHHIKEVRLEHPFQSIPFDRRKSMVITCLAEICSKCITTADPHPELFAFLHDELVEYDDPESYDRDFMIRFLAELTHYLGFGMDLSQATSKGMYFDLLNGHLVDQKPLHDYLMPADDYEVLKSIVVNKGKVMDVPISTRRRLVDQLITYFQLHVESLREVN
ncbi:MAG TPA: DNA repair protein RecO, partial [Saprospiraceae bacterium]|nr:DNA repair protein RecO [Saprospiraceae bacterium]